eukprot:Ihof_evm5s219 gene=Ihof_evmTU5s219
MATAPETVEEALMDLQKSLLSLKDSFTTTTLTTSNDETTVSREEFGTQLGQVAKAIVKDSTMLSISFTAEQPSIKEVAPLSVRLWDRMSVIYSMGRLVPSTVGEALTKEYHDVVKNILVASVKYVEILQGLKGSTKDHLAATGILWEECERVEKLPQDNMQCVIGHMKSIESLVLDAVKEVSEELAEAAECDSDDEDEWSEEEKKTANCVLGLVRACGQSIVRLRREQLPRLNPDVMQHVIYSDNINKAVMDMSSLVDNVSVTIYPPQSNADLLEAANHLSTA